MDSEVTKSLTIIGTAIGAGGVGALGAFVSQRRQLKKYQQPDRRLESTKSIVDKTVTATRQAVEESMRLHLGTTNGEIKEDIAEIKAWIKVACPEKHNALNDRVRRLEDVRIDPHL